jgi:hypothetical protein
MGFKMGVAQLFLRVTKHNFKKESGRGVREWEWRRVSPLARAPSGGRVTFALRAPELPDDPHGLERSSTLHVYIFIHKLHPYHVPVRGFCVTHIQPHKTSTQNLLSVHRQTRNKNNMQISKLQFSRPTVAAAARPMVVAAPNTAARRGAAAPRSGVVAASFFGAQRSVWFLFGALNCTPAQHSPHTTTTL